MQTSQIIRYLIRQLDTAIGLNDAISFKGDPENLHQFRVALRRIRSLLTLYFPDAYAFDEIIKTIFKNTNELRELDVLLMSIDPNKYEKLYSALHKHRKERFKKRLPAKVRAAQKEVLHNLHTDFIFFYVDDPEMPLERIALDNYSKAMERYKKRSKKSSEALLHQLRIDFKIARYALEFLHEEGYLDSTKVIRKCKKILEKLGSIQDSTNQLQFLEKICKRLELHECKTLLKARKKAHKKLMLESL